MFKLFHNTSLSLAFMWTLVLPLLTSSPRQEDVQVAVIFTVVGVITKVAIIEFSFIIVKNAIQILIMLLRCFTTKGQSSKRCVNVICEVHDCCQMPVLIVSKLHHFFKHFLERFIIIIFSLSDACW
jgi:hypothetical protein